MLGDPRVSDVDNFISKTHSSVPESLLPEKMRLPEQFTVCIIGASYGIGEHIAYAYARAAVANLCLAARSDLAAVAEKCKEVATNSAFRVETRRCDIADNESVKQLAEFVKEKFGRLDAVVPNAAYAGPVTLRMDEGEPEWVERAFQVNAMGQYYVSRHFVPLLLESENRKKGFIAIGSIAGCIRRGIIANMQYCVSKMTQTRMVEYLSEQYGKDGLVAICLHPGAVETPMAKDNTPEAFIPYLTDDIDLCGAVCVWISKQIQGLQWMNGRMMSATWDMDELMSRRGEVEGKDLLKYMMAVR